MGMTVEKLMTAPVVSICEDATVFEACRLLLRHHISGLPVVDAQGYLVGIVTESDLMGLLLEPAHADTPVADYMTRPCVSLRPDDSLLAALEEFRCHGYRRLPVVSDDGRPLGVMARREFVRFVAEVHLRLGEPAGREMTAPAATL
ncbi:MAG: CBS domain-containing protein [Pirellulales bacterium]|nr:CBS domain-containing protein [Pirellulales bacterium]